MLDFLNNRKPRRMRIVRNGHPALRQRSAEIVTIGEEERQLAERMVVTLLESEVPGVGLAAPQVGVNKRMIVIDTKGDERDEKASAALSPGEMLFNPMMPVVFVNPQILAVSEEKNVCGEGCLSLPGVSGTVERPRRVLLRAMTMDGQIHEAECDGLLARCLQHEIDHLDGVLFVDHISEEEMEKAAPTLARMAKAEQKYVAR
jgi:peptide deformylase